MAGSVLALAVLVVLPLAFLVWGSINTDGHLTLAHFRDAVSSRLYTQALRNSLILGISTAVLSVAVGLPLAWAVGRTNVPGKQFIHLTAVVSYLTPPFLTAIALSQSAVGGQAVQVAIRPESLRLTLPAPTSTADPVGTVPGKLADVTFLGNIIDCHVTLDDGTRVRVQVDSAQTLEVGQRVGVRFDSQQSSVFS